MCQSGSKRAADAAQEELKYFFKVVAKSDELQILIVFDGLDSDTRSY